MEAVSVLTGTHDLRLVLLSVVVGIMASYAALDLAGRATATSGRTRSAWLIGGSVVMGTGINSMHFIGMSGFHLPVPVFYHVPTVILALLLAIGASGIALFVASREEMNPTQALVGSSFIGLGIVAMHYTGMTALRLPAIIHYNFGIVALSVIIAMAVSLVSVWLTFRMRDETEILSRNKIGSALSMGLAISCMHYTGMSATSFTLTDIAVNYAATIQVSVWEAGAVGLMTSIVLAGSVLVSTSGRLEHLVQERTSELVQSQNRLRAFASELGLTEQRERKRLAVELHDHLQQMLVLGKIKLGQAKPLLKVAPGSAEVIKEVDAVLTKALTYTRTLVSELSPPVLRDHGLAAGLKWVGDYMKKHDMVVTVTIEQEGLKLPEEQAVLLFQSVRELLMNSWKHAGTGQATVTMQQQSSMLRIEVRDEGKGFELASAETPHDLSSKFGLFSIQERMKALGGTFDIESVAGLGTKCVLILPLREGSMEPVREPNYLVEHATERSLLPAQGPIRVVLVDDHAMMRQGLRSVLEQYPDVQIVAEAANGIEAVHAVEQFQPAVVIMDINMPKMDGIEATALIKAKVPSVHVIGLSVNTEGDNYEAMLKAGAYVLLTKEAAVDQLYDMIQEAVKLGQLQYQS
jgi:NO-binding membrane sensor protein with MHYT domain/CheY-like chemotaxis protein/anti-sigma regulatory factor (Ser/Thr protein kinase)